MTVSTKGVIKGRQIQLDRKTGLPEGARVQVWIKLRAQKRDQRKQLAQLFGSWRKSSGSDT